MRSAKRQWTMMITLVVGSSLLTTALQPAAMTQSRKYAPCLPTQLRQAQPMSMLPEQPQQTVKLTAAMSPRQFEAWVIYNSRKLYALGQSPDLPRKELIARLKVGQYVTDNAILAVVAASTNADTPTTPAGTSVEVHPAGTYRLIDTLLGIVYGRPGLAAELH